MTVYNITLIKNVFLVEFWFFKRATVEKVFHRVQYEILSKNNTSKILLENFINAFRKSFGKKGRR